MATILQLPSSERGDGHVSSLKSEMVYPARTVNMGETLCLAKPADYSDVCSIVGNLPYQCEDGLKGAPMAGGVLAKGGTVWVQRFREGKKASGSTRHVSAYAEGIGMVSVDSRWLVRDAKAFLQELAG